MADRNWELCCLLPPPGEVTVALAWFLYPWTQRQSCRNQAAYPSVDKHCGIQFWGPLTSISSFCRSWMVCVRDTGYVGFGLCVLNSRATLKSCAEPQAAEGVASPGEGTSLNCPRPCPPLPGNPSRSFWALLVSGRWAWWLEEWETVFYLQGIWLQVILWDWEGTGH